MAAERGAMDGWTERTVGHKQADGLTGKKMQESQKYKGNISLFVLVVAAAAAFVRTWRTQPADVEATRGFVFSSASSSFFIADMQLITNTEKENNF